MKKKSNKTKGLMFENIVAKMLNRYSNYNVESKTIGSGCFWHSKGDLVIRKRSDLYLAEIKGTNKSQYRLSSKLIGKIWNEALDSNKIPLFLILFEAKNVRALVILEVGLMASSSSNVYPKTFLIKAEHLDKWYLNDGGCIQLRNDGTEWVLGCQVIKEGI